MTSRIHTMRTYFVGPAAHYDVSVRTFAVELLRQRKQAVQQQLRTQGFIQASLMDTLAVQLGDPDNPALLPVLRPYVNGSCWLVKCDDCGGVEFLDFDDPIFMCCTCWNEAKSHRWRRVVVPRPLVRAMIERILLKRPQERTRSWYPTESLRELAAENLKHEVEVDVAEEDLVAAEAEVGP